MRGLMLAAVFFGLLPFVFFKGPFVGILIWYWISLMNPHQDVWGSMFGRIPYALIVALATLLSLLVAKREPKLPPPSKVTTLIVLLMIWSSITSLLGIGPPAEIYDKWLLGEKMLLMTLVAYTLTTTRDRLDQLIAVCVGSIAIYGVKGGLFALLTGGRYRVFGPDASMIGDNNDLGVALTMVLPLMFYLRERYRRPAVRHGLLVLIGLTFLGDVFTYSRGALVALIAMASVLWIRSNKKVQILMLIAVAGAGLWNFAPPEWTGRMGTIEHYQEDSSAEGRIGMWKRAWAIAQLRPIVGAGFQWSFAPQTVNRLLSRSGLPSMTRPVAVHSSWFEMLSSQGFVGLFILIGIIAATLVDLRWLVRHSRGDPELSWANNFGRTMQASVIGFCAGASFSTHAMYDGFYAIVIIAAAARHIVAAQLARGKVAAPVGINVAAAKPGGFLTAQPGR